MPRRVSGLRDRCGVGGQHPAGVTSRGRRLPRGRSHGGQRALCEAGLVVVRVHVQHLISLKGKFTLGNTRGLKAPLGFAHLAQLLGSSLLGIFPRDNYTYDAHRCGRFRVSPCELEPGDQPASLLGPRGSWNAGRS